MSAVLPLAPLFAFIDSLDRLDLHRPLNKHCPQKVNERLNSSCAFLLFWSERGGYNGAGRAEADGCQISSALLPVPVCEGRRGRGWHSALWGENNLGIGFRTVAASLHRHRGLSHLLRCHIRSGTQTAHMRANTWRNRTSPPVIGET